MARRGKVLRDPYAGPGLIIVEGQQHQFFLERIWHSEVPPKPGLPVVVDFDAQGKVARVTPVPETELAKEQAEMTTAAQETETELAWTMVTKFGLPTLVAAGLLLVSWWFLPAASVEVPFVGRWEFTFWQLLGYLNSGNSSHALDPQGSPSPGFYGFLALVAVLAPFVHHYWKDRRALLGGLLPLLFMLLIGILLVINVHGTVAGLSQGAYNNLPGQAPEQLAQTIAMGVGTYVSMLITLYFAALG
jgi:hypothetical protein